MANELLDFVMSVVRDPDIAAQYAANPAQAIADAHLTDVTSADVNNLIPMVSDSISMAAPSFGADHSTDGNVWTSGAATAAFDAFTPHGADLPDQSVITGHDLSSAVIDTSAFTQVDSAPLHDIGGLDAFDASAQLNELPAESAPVDPGSFGLDNPGIWDHPSVDQIEHHLDANHPGFDILD
jgi:hypothetical protein